MPVVIGNFGNFLGEQHCNLMVVCAYYTHDTVYIAIYYVQQIGHSFALVSW